MMWVTLADVGDAGAGPPAAVGTRVELEREVADTLVRVLPWGVSVLLHVGLMMLAVFVVWTSVRQIHSEPPIIPDVRLSERPGAPLTQTESKLERQETTRRTIAPSSSDASLITRKVEIKTLAIGVAGGADSRANPFGLSEQDVSPFKTGFMGAGGNARTVALVIDASGSLIDTMPFVIAELMRTVGDLREEQSFAVLFFQDDKVVEAPPTGLTKATPQAKTRLLAWLDAKAGNVAPQGMTSPLAAVRKALAYRPQLVYILSDNITGRGRYEIDQQTLLAQIQAANVAGTKINTIQFLYRDPLEAYGLAPTLKLIADKSGGVYKFVDAGELGLR